VLTPTPRLLALLAVLVPVSIAFAVWPQQAEAERYVYAFAAVLVLVDALRARLAPLPAVERRAPQAYALGTPRDVVVVLAGTGRGSMRVTCHDHAPVAFECRGLPQTVVAPPPGQACALHYTVRPLRRGEHAYGPIELRVESPWRLWQRHARVAADATARVYPNFSALARYALFATDNRLSQLGILRRRRRGEGLDFHQLREYREGDSQRQIDWKASSRMGKLISREYQDERDQQIVLLLDCGRRMGARDGALSHLDHVLNAALLLAFVALRQGDAVGLATLAGDARWFAPKKSLATVTALMNLTYDLEASGQSPDFQAAAVDLVKRLRKRALVVIVTNLRDEDDQNLAAAITLLSERHLVLVASLREAILGQGLRAEVESLDDALKHAATAEYLERRDQAFARLERRAIPCVDVEPGALALALVNRYLDLKLSGRL